MTYLAILEKGEHNYSAFVPDVSGAVGVGATREKTLRSVAEGLVLMLHDLAERGMNAPTPTPREHLDAAVYEAEEPYEIVEVAPTAMNPVSLEIERAIAATGLSEAEVARRMGTSRAAMSRITNPFYFGHSLNTLRRLAEALGMELEVNFQRAV